MKKVALIFILCIIPFTVSAKDFPTRGDIYWLTQNIYHESRGESEFGQLLVGIVTLERLRSGRWGNTIHKVVTANKQFSWYSDGKSDMFYDAEAWQKAKSIARLAIMINEKLDMHGVMFYHKDSRKPYWADDMIRVVSVGRHIFYKRKK